MFRWRPWSLIVILLVIFASAAIVAAEPWEQWRSRETTEDSRNPLQEGELRWEQWLPLEGVVDLGGPRSDGRLVAMAAGRLFLVAPDGAIAPFARDQGGYAGPPDAELYLVVVPPNAPPLADCRFARDDVFILDFGPTLGLARVNSTGQSSRFATVPNVEFLSGIVFDTAGKFGYRILVSGHHDGNSTIAAVDCMGRVSIVTTMAPLFEGGLAVAPLSFGSYAGDLIAPDEQTGQIWAIAPDGSFRLVFTADLPKGGDTGVESLGFVPPGFGGGGYAYLADRGTNDNPFSGTNSILRLRAEAISASGARPGDLLVSTEGDGLTIAVRCEQTCTAIDLPDGPPGGHIEGHILVVPAP